MKKLTALLMALVMALSIGALTALADSYQPGIYEIVVDDPDPAERFLNVRAGIPNSGSYSTILGQVWQGEKVEVVEVVNTDWGKIIYDGQEGYIRIIPSYAKFVSAPVVSEEPSEEPSVEAPSEEPAVSEEASVEEPASEEASVEESVADESVVSEEASAEESVADESAVSEEASTEESVAEESTASEEASAEESKTESKADESKADDKEGGNGLVIAIVIAVVAVVAVAAVVVIKKSKK